MKKLIEASFAIDGHHKGLPDNANWKVDTDQYKNNDVENFENVLKNFLNDTCYDQNRLSNLKSPDFKEQKSQRELFVRYLFSALTDGDWLSTEEHFELDTAKSRAKIELPVDEMLEKLEKEYLKKSKAGNLNELRNKARAEVIKKAPMPPGFYSLALPTGLGKTLTSMAWALTHAKANGLKRIIVVLPYVNIIDQTAKIFKEIFGEEYILEHHSGYNEDGRVCLNKDEFIDIERKKKELACENWDFPIIVTTTVQFFESLFSNRPSKCRKIHSIAEAVVVFDEVQTLPKQIILPTLQMLKDMNAVMKTSFLFCTATQPAFEKRYNFDGIENIEPLINDPAELYEKTIRVRYSFVNDLNQVDMNTLFGEVSACDNSVLVVFNTKKSTRDFFDISRNSDKWEKKYHLSTAMCPHHRKEIIKSISNDLNKGVKILVSSTQLIEAGVDFDFPAVFRAKAPLESIIQVAGRCNREGKLGVSGGNVFIFDLADGRMPDKTYSACAGHAVEMLKIGTEKLYCHNIFNDYYRQILNLYVDPDKNKIVEARSAFNFETVNDAYRLIDNATYGIYAYTYNSESAKLLDSLKFKKFLSRDDYRKMQTFMVQVYRNFINDNQQFCSNDPHGILVWYGNYDRECGLSATNKNDDILIV